MEYVRDMAWQMNGLNGTKKIRRKKWVRVRVKPSINLTLFIPS